MKHMSAFMDAVSEYVHGRSRVREIDASEPDRVSICPGRARKADFDPVPAAKRPEREKRFKPGRPARLLGRKPHRFRPMVEKRLCRSPETVAVAKPPIIVDERSDAPVDFIGFSPLEPRMEPRTKPEKFADAGKKLSFFGRGRLCERFE